MNSLPYVCHWSDSVFTPSKQIEMIEGGVPLMANVDLKVDGDYGQDYINLLRICRSLGVPITVVSTQWEQSLVGIGNTMSPFDDPSEYFKPAKTYAYSEGMKRLQTLYPSPKELRILLNNETPKRNWANIQEEMLYGIRYNEKVSDNQKREILRDAWIARFNTMFNASRQYLSKGWSNVVKFIGFNAFPRREVGRYKNWVHCSTHTKELLDWSFGCYNGGCLSCYMDNWSNSRDYWTRSPIIEAMNYLWEKEYAPVGYEIEICTWDGNSNWCMGDPLDTTNSKTSQYLADGQEWGVNRWKGVFQGLLWIMRCTARPWREYNVNAYKWEKYTQAEIDSVCLVHENALLKRFWQHGELIPNIARAHPYQNNVPEEWEQKRRFYLLETDEMPEELELYTEIPVWAIAFKIGQEFLLYAYAPLGKRSCEVIVPGFGTVEIMAPPEGVFIHLNSKYQEVVA